MQATEALWDPELPDLAAAPWGREFAAVGRSSPLDHEFLFVAAPRDFEFVAVGQDLPWDHEFAAGAGLERPAGIELGEMESNR